MEKILESISDVISWFNLLFMEENYQPWKIYWYGMTSQLDAKSLDDLGKRMQFGEQEKRSLISQHLLAADLLDRLFRIEMDDNFGIYTLLSQYDTEILLFMMAKANNEKVKKIFSIFFTKLKDTKIKIRGKDLMEIGIEPGPEYKKIFNYLLKSRLNNEVNTKKDEIRLVRKLLEKLDEV